MAPYGAAGVVIEDHLRRLEPGRRYVQLHTHPGSSAFSLRDAILLAATPEVRTMAVIGVDGT